MSESIINAGNYVNRQLLAKGYLRDEETIEFIGDCSSDEGNTRRIINIIYALLQSNDSLSATVSSQSRQILELQRELSKSFSEKQGLEKAVDDLERQVSTLEGNAISKDIEIRKLGIKARSAKEDAQRWKIEVDKVRERACVEIRKRDWAVEKMRGTLKNPTRKSIAMPLSVASLAPNREETYKKNETTIKKRVENDKLDQQEDVKSLIHLYKTVSSENSRLISLVQTTIVCIYKLKSPFLTLKNSSELEETDLDGLISQAHADLKTTDGIADSTAALSLSLPVTSLELSRDMKLGLQEIWDLLHSEEFAMLSMEGIRRKEKEITNLKDQLATMTAQWQKAIQTMEQWDTYRTIKKSGSDGSQKLRDRFTKKPDLGAPKRAKLT
ncbi:hypothetical protein NADFUDRAFT_48889 [Nadsonia fulvescens var. elongata DSM 6958]|uniref:Afadin and alpha-actinin-binding-domain-containing protein n=1 Tax=Nadsonia fulvescens var. elongata DSM 6958 TaxID=857566 RepID=A0A1E3PSI3_9ASCO|nr:hypothetical protein NADFUDRAFT_48889 [Nadsonia fulvescens var. elongata DSM 6958]